MDSRFCRECGTYLSRLKERGSSTTPSLKISRRTTNIAELPEHPKIKRAIINTEIAYFLGLFLARGKLTKDSIIVRIPCKPANAPSHKDFLLNCVVPRMEKATGEKIEVRGDLLNNYSFDIMIRSEFFLRLLTVLDYKVGEVCRFFGAPFEIFNSTSEIQRDFVRGIGDCCGEVDRYIGGRPRVVLRFLNENTRIVEDVIEVLLRLTVDVFDVNLSPASAHHEELSTKLRELADRLTSTFGVNVTGRQEQIGRDNMVRIWGDEYYRQIGFNNPARQTKLLRYLGNL